MGDQGAMMTLEEQSRASVCCIAQLISTTKDGVLSLRNIVKKSDSLFCLISN